MDETLEDRIARELRLANVRYTQAYYREEGDPDQKWEEAIWYWREMEEHVCSGK